MLDHRKIEKTQEIQTKNLFNPFSLLGYILGGLSLLNLVREFKLIKLYGLVKDWTDAFSYFILTVRDFLFGWIEISWLSITDYESYILVIVFLFISSFLRALITVVGSRSDVNNNDDFFILGTIITGFIFYATIFMLFAIFALILPNYITIIIFSILVFCIVIWMLFPGKNSNPIAVNRTKMNLVGSFTIFLILVAVNYGFK